MYINANEANTSKDNGIAGGDYDSDKIILRAMTAFTAIAWYNAIEILVLIFFAFKRYSGLYFWALLVTTIGVIPYATGAKDFSYY